MVGSKPGPPPQLVKKKNKGGRPRVWSKILPPIRVRRELFARLERRLMLIQARTGIRNLSDYMRLALVGQLDSDDKEDRKTKRRKEKSAPPVAERAD